MKGIFSLLGFFLLTGSLVAQKSVTSINKGWQFSKATIPQKESDWENIDLPHTWNKEDVMDDIPGYYRGFGYYKKQLYIGKLKKDQQLNLLFEGANQVATIFVNGKKAGEHIGGYASFYIPITNLVQPGKQNEIMVSVDNAYQQDIPPLTADFTFYGGIYRDVWLVKTEPVHFSTKEDTKGVYLSTPIVETQRAVLKVKASIEIPENDKSAYLITSILKDAQGNIVHKASTPIRQIFARSDSNYEQELTINNPNLWSPEKPYLYRLTTAITNSKTGKLLDQVVQPIGFRWFRFDPEKGFELNGKPYKLVGTSRHQDFKGMGNALPDRFARNDIALLKKMGGNFLRVAHYPQDPSILEACDSLGILTSVEIPVVNEITTTKKFFDNCMDMQLQMIRQHYNHTSVIIWCYMNEVLLKPHYTNDKDKQILYFKEINKLAKSLDSLTRKTDPSRYTMMAHHGDYNKYKEVGLVDIPMIVGWNLYSGWYGGKLSDFPVFLDSFHARHPEKILVVSEYGADADPRISSNSPIRFDKSVEYTTKFHQFYISAMLKRPFVAAAMIWNLADFNSETRNETMPHINNKGLMEWDRTPKDPYYLYQALLSDKPVLKILGFHNKVLIEDSINKKSASTITQVATNLNEVELFMNEKSLGKKQPIEGLAEWKVQLSNGNNRLFVSGKKNNQTISDEFLLNSKVVPKQIKDIKQFSGLNILLGSNRSITDADKLVWIPTLVYEPGGWGVVGGKPFKIPNNNRLPYGTDKNIIGTDDDPVYQTQQVGINMYKLDLPKGNYELVLHFAELLGGSVKELPYNLNDPERIEPKGKRIFNVYINKQLLLDNFDIAAQYGTATAVKKTTNITITNDSGIEIVFESVEGEPVLNALQVKKID